ncbi:MAG: hypothetical protein E7411_04330 [Ruminococcaceae bacterium]|nr:hypothetical protein [Oscillospiraceae bacterium]
MDAIREKWLKMLGTPSYEIGNGEMTFEKAYEYEDYTVEMYIQKNGPQKSQRVSMAIPKNKAFPCPAVVVPFYYREAMLGFNPETNEKIDRFCDYPIMTDLAKRGYITISADAFYRNYEPENYTGEGFSQWKIAAEALKRDNPEWTGMSKLITDTQLLVNALIKDKRADSEKIGIMGHSLGGKMSFYTACLDDRIKVMVASDFGFGWEQTNWTDIWYLGDKVSLLKDMKMDHTELLGTVYPKPFCLIAGEFDNQESIDMIYKAKGYDNDKSTLKMINHQTGHKPPKDALEAAYDFLDKYLKN